MSQLYFIEYNSQCSYFKEDILHIFNVSYTELVRIQYFLWSGCWVFNENVLFNTKCVMLILSVWVKIFPTTRESVFTKTFINLTYFTRSLCTIELCMYVPTYTKYFISPLLKYAYSHCNSLTSCFVYVSFWKMTYYIETNATK